MKWGGFDFKNSFEKSIKEQNKNSFENSFGVF